VIQKGSEVLHVIIKGRPIPFVRTTQKQKFVDERYKRYQVYKQLVQISTRNQFKGSFGDSKLVVSINVYLSGSGVFKMGADGDIDNYIKSILDSLNKLVFNDDRQVMKVIGEKIVCDKGLDRVEIWIDRLE
jgi:Holliday junction resolvase RusA-like endonuclease